MKPELLQQAKNAKTEKELLALAEANGMKLTEEEAKKYWDELHREGELPEDELANVAGGLCDDDPMEHRPPVVEMGYAPDGAVVCPKCMGGLDYPGRGKDAGGDYDSVMCYHCGLAFRHYWTGDQWTQEG